MKVRTRSYRRWIRGVALGLAAAAIAAPVAQAIDPAVSGQPMPKNNAWYATGIPPAPGSAPGTIAPTDVSPLPGAAPGDGFGVAVSRPTSDDGFDLVNGGIGAAVGTAFGLLLAGGAFLIARRRHDRLVGI